MRKFFLRLAFLPLFAIPGWRYQLEISLFLERFSLKDLPSANAATVHLAALPGRLDGVFVEKTPLFSRKTENLILVTLDGFRWQELFGGADSLLINNPESSRDTAALRRLFWAKNPDGRRRKLMPFFWENLAPAGLVFGNQWLGSRCEVSNPYWFSYPGYAEMLCGKVDSRLNSNRKVDNPNPTVLEFLNGQKPLHGRVAAYASWDVFPAIYNEERSGLNINAAVETPSGRLTCRERLLDALQKIHPSPWDGVRDDLYTFALGMEFLKKEKPRVMAFHLDGTDDAAHDGRYDAYLKFANQADNFLKILWKYIESEPFYREKTAIVVTCDHGRGQSNGGGWREHGRFVGGADQIWLAVVSPETAAGGEVRGPHDVIFQKQIGPTMAALLGYEFLPDDPEAGRPIRAFFKNENAFTASAGN